LFMRAVAERRVLAAFAGAEEDALRLRRDVLDRREFGVLVGAVAERLARGQAAGAPPQLLARRHLDRSRRFAANRRFAHVALPASVWIQASPQAFASSRTRRI